MRMPYAPFDVPSTKPNIGIWAQTTCKFNCAFTQDTSQTPDIRIEQAPHVWPRRLLFGLAGQFATRGYQKGEVPVAA